MTDYAEMRAALDAGPTPGPWRVQDGCSWRRIGSDLGDGDILRPVVNQNDGWPDLAARRETLNYIAAANPTIIRALLAERDAMKATLEEALIWHEAQDKAISKQPNANTGHKGWMRAQHQEQAALIRAALAQEQS